AVWRLGLSDRGASQAVERAVARGHLQPAAGVLRDPVARPPLQRSSECILGAFLREVPIAGDADQVRDDPPPLRAEGVAHRLFGVHAPQTGLTSTVPNSAAGF